MKSFVSILLAAVLLLFSLSAAAGAEFYDEVRFADEYRTAIVCVSAKGIISGFPDKTFLPNDPLTRAQAAKILCTALEGASAADAVTAAETVFSDVPASHWASGFIAWCADKGIVAGLGDGKFNPDGRLSSAAFAKMLLVAYGHDPVAEGLVGAQWIENTEKALRASGFDKGVKEIGTKPLKRDAACQLTYNFVLAAEENELAEKGYPRTEFPLTEQKNFRVLGRAVHDGEGLICDFSASGAECTLDCAGTLWATVGTTKATNVRFRACVDGIWGEAVTFSPKLPTQPLFCNIAPGVHTIRIVKDVEVDETAVRLQAVSIGAKPETIRASAPRPYLIECVGDSITAGWGIYGPNARGVSTITAAQAYGIRTADALNADCTLVCRGGIGLQRESGGATIDAIYSYQNYYRDKETKFAFSRKPDVVVMAIGTNDRQEEGYYEQMKGLVEQIRSCYHDESLKIVFIHSMMNDRHIAAFEQLEKEDPCIWRLQLPKNRAGYGNHPTAEAHAGYAKTLTDFIKTIL